jgi:hypothetical protein
VYRLYDVAGTLLYIGSAYDPAKRSRAHHRTPWWPQVTRRADEWFDSRSQAYDAETSAIWTEQPMHNEAGTIGYRRTGVSNPPRQRASYLAWTGLRDACGVREAEPAYKAALERPDEVDAVYLPRAERIAAELIEDIQGLGWNARRRTLETGRRLMAGLLGSEGADDFDVATVMGVAESRIRRLPYLLDDERYGTRRAPDGTITYVAYAVQRNLRQVCWSIEVPSGGCGGPLVDRREDVASATRLAVSKSLRIPYESVAIRVRFDT